MSYSLKSVLSIAGSDSSGGAGIQADIKTIEAMGLYAQTAITALTAQNTTGVTGILNADSAFVRTQIDAVFSDICPDAIKVGMVSSADLVQSIAEGLSAHDAYNVVVDPVMVATSGSHLMGEGVKDVLVDKLFPLASIVTPNIPEAEALSGVHIASKSDMEKAARIIASFTPGAVLVKGGHNVDLARADDLLLVNGAPLWIPGKRVNTTNTHGTGCTLSSAIACGLACGLDMHQSVTEAKRYLAGALAAGLSIGKGCGPLDHMWALRPRIDFTQGACRQQDSQDVPFIGRN